MSLSVRLGISTCPNDTFAFHGLLNRHVDWRGLDFQVELLDVQELNQQLRRGSFDVAKASFHAALRLTDSTVVLPSGSALGFGVGPLLLTRHLGRTPNDRFETSPIVLCPGEHTTATLLYRLFYPRVGTIRQVVFSDIMPALQKGSGDFGVCIHEGRFTWQESQLGLVSDLGVRWEQETELPLPLGGILAQRALGSEVIKSVHKVIRESIQYGLDHRRQTLPTMRRYAQEYSDKVLMAHVDLYVNQNTINLGRAGREALDKMFELAVRAGVVNESTKPIEIFAER